MDWENLTYYMVERVHMIKRDGEEWDKSGHESRESQDNVAGPTAAELVPLTCFSQLR